MKPFKWQHAAIILLLFFGLFPLHGQTPEAFGTNAENTEARQKVLTLGLRRYEASLRAEVEGVVESAIFHVVMIRLQNPHQDYSKSIRELKRLSFEATSPKLRYEAYLGACLISNPEQFLSASQSKELLGFTDERRNEFFAFLAAALEHRLAE